MDFSDVFLDWHRVDGPAERDCRKEPKDFFEFGERLYVDTPFGRLRAKGLVRE